jgi:hypothetical protein
MLEKIVMKETLDARTFQQHLRSLANTIALKVEREGPLLPLKPVFVSADITVLIRQALNTYDLFFFVNADDRRKKDCDWKVAYSAVILPLIRCMIDCLYNITVILENPVMAYQFRTSGYKLALLALESDEKRYGGDPRWDAHIASRREFIRTGMRLDGFTAADVDSSKIWPTMSAYLRPEKNVPLTPHQEFLTKLTLGFWQEYSGIAHATFQGLMLTAMCYVTDKVPPEEELRFEDALESMLFIQMTRVAAILLCTLTEVQAHCRFGGARINERLHEIWNALLKAPEIKELYDERYSKLMQDKGIRPDKEFD